MNSPLDALECFTSTGLDLLILGDYLISKSETPPIAWISPTTSTVCARRTRHSEAFGPALARAQRVME